MTTRRAEEHALDLFDAVVGAELAAEADSAEAIARYDAEIAQALAEIAAAGRSEAPEEVDALKALCDEAVNERWRAIYARTDGAAASPRRGPVRASMDRPAMLAHLEALRTRRPALVAHHRELDELSDELLAGLIKDIEAVVGDDDGTDGAGS